MKQKRNIAYNNLFGKLRVIIGFLANTSSPAAPGVHLELPVVTPVVTPVATLVVSPAVSPAVSPEARQGKAVQLRVGVCQLGAGQRAFQRAA